MDEGGIWGETCMSFHKIMAIANEHTTSVLGNLAVTLLEEYEKCHGITRELLITDDSDTLQGVVA